MESLIQNSNPIAQEYPPLSNIFTVHVKSSELLKCVQLEIDIQRELDMEWVTELREKIIEHYQNYKFFFFGVFEVAHMNNQIYMINGQHRYFVLKELHEKHGDIPVEVKIYPVSTGHDLNELWMKVNGSKPSKMVKSTSKQILINSIRKYFTINYPDYCTNSDKPCRPNINLDQLERELEQRKVFDILDIDNSDDFINMVECLNNFYRYTDLAKWQVWGMDDTLVHKCRTKNIIKPLFLGLFQNYEWLIRLIEVNRKDSKIDSYRAMPHLKLNAKSRKISKAKRRLVWQKRNSKASMIGKCYVCRRPIDYDEFECGHVLAHFWGGTCTLDNLEPICGSCNKDMSTENLYDYKKNFFGKPAQQLKN